MFEQRICLSILIGSLLVSNVYATEEIHSKKQVSIPTSEIASDGSRVMKTITLLPHEAHSLKNEFSSTQKFELDYSKGVVPFSKSSRAVDLGMKDVPVLDQGEEGTCATFAMTGFLDAYLNRGDFISQQCTIELSVALGTNSWEGTTPDKVFNSLQMYGVVDHKSCNAEYPDKKANLSIMDYISMTSKDVYLYSLYSMNQKPNLSEVKNELNAGRRVIAGFNLTESDDDDPTGVNGFDFKIEKQEKTGGLWACQQPGSPNYCAQREAGAHAVIFIGYDDKQKLFKVRNSWGTTVGDEGDYYMTYQFFEQMAFVLYTFPSPY